MSIVDHVRNMIVNLVDVGNLASVPVLASSMPPPDYLLWAAIRTKARLDSMPEAALIAEEDKARLRS